MMKRCYCSKWEAVFTSDGVVTNPDCFFVAWDDGGELDIFPDYCPFCGKPLAESQSQQKRLKVQLGQKDA